MEGTEEKKSKQKEIGALELDKFDVTASVKRPDRPAKAKKAPEKVEPSKTTTWTQKNIFSFKSWIHGKPLRLMTLARLTITNKVFICSLLAGLTVGLPAVVYSLILVNRHQELSNRQRGIVYVIASSLGDRNYVRFKLRVPLKADKEKADLMQKLHKIRRLLLDSENHPEVGQPVVKKDLDAIQEYILGIVKGITGIPIPELALEELFLD